MPSVVKTTTKESRSSSSDDDDDDDDFHFVLEEIVFNVLTRLPAKFVVQCKIVSKLWRSIISDPLFAKAHRTRSAGSGGFLITPADARLPQQHIFLAPHGGGESSDVFHPQILPAYYVTEVIDGLVCFNPTEEDFPVVICNITTHEIATLPESFNFNERRMPSSYFGFDPINNEYKVLAVHTMIVLDGGGPRVVIECEILTLCGRDSSWRRIGDAPHVFSGHSVCFNGALHWLAKPKSKLLKVHNYLIDDDEEWDQLLVIFDLQHEIFRVISPPAGQNELYTHIVQLGGGRLALASASQCSSDGMLFLHPLMSAYDNPESVAWGIVVTDLPSAVRELSCYAAVGSIPTTGEVLLAPRELSSPLPIFACDPVTKKWRRVEINEFPTPGVSDGLRFRISCHVENVISLRNLVDW